MILKPGDPGYIDLGSVERTLPDWDDIKYLGGLGLGATNLKAEVAYENSMIWSVATQIGFQGVTTGIGAPTGLFDAMVDAMNIDVVAISTDVMEQAAGTISDALGKMTESTDELLETSLEQGVGFAVNFATIIPIIGWIVQIAWKVGNMIADIVKLAKAGEDPKHIYPETRFSPEADRSTLNRAVLDRLKTNDWSRLFYPPGVGRAAISGRRIHVMNLEGGGVRIITARSHADDGWVGFVPGTAWLHSAIETSGKQIIETGTTFLPSSAQQCMWIWRNISRTNSPSTFTVWAEKAGAMWGEYIEDLRVAVNETSELNSDMKKEIFKKYDRVEDGNNVYPVFEWGDGISSVPDGYAPTNFMETLRRRQLDFCDTLTVAYVDAGFGALNDPAVKSKWEDRRKDLLEHPALCDVDVDSIPDAIYRGAVEYRKSKQHCDVIGGINKLAAVVAPPINDGFASPDGEWFPGGVSIGTLRPGRMPIPPRGSRHNDDNTVALILGGLALAGGSYWAWNNKDKLRSVGQQLKRRVGIR